MISLQFILVLYFMFIEAYLMKFEVMSYLINIKNSITTIITLLSLSIGGIHSLYHCEEVGDETNLFITFIDILGIFGIWM